MDVTKPYEFLGFGAMDATKPYEFIGFEGPSSRSDPTRPTGFGSEILVWTSVGRLGPHTRSQALRRAIKAEVCTKLPGSTPDLPPESSTSRIFIHYDVASLAFAICWGFRSERAFS